MMESINDLLSFGTVIFFVLASIYLMFLVSNRHHENYMKDMEDRYYHFYNEADDSTDDDDSDGPYYEA